jgi:uncharacterized metal-binding protein YceD (DUF177 family)
MKPDAPPPWSVPVVVHSVPEAGRHFELSADAATRAAVALALGLRELPRLRARFDLSRHGRDGVSVTGEVRATVGQECVVTLEPVESELNEVVDLKFMPVVESSSKVASEDAPEPLIGGMIDLGKIATEFLAVGIDPYPRKPGATFDAPVIGDDSEHPFAALAALKKEPGGDGH